ncbi:SGNH/GDSL hydrolase family protein [Bacillus sp. V2I10]|uniref:SGNH/GDSL hydrolase family protein n=1 Tax=Bacillus sp. V2I10 TaxID=3042276 RepID=UPI00278401BA|nr:SGNH/GDSL hydrolase family protein [Bacillus sp. V2I10]MDQ0857208.1 lysophospholipase L1-like esterase [Bacillus sp. V2I10]
MQRKLTLSLIVALVALIISLPTSLFYISNQKQQINELEEQVKKNNTNILLIGSSVTKGVGASTPEKSWPGLLYTFISKENPDINFINLGVNGYTTQNIISNSLKITENFNSQNLTPNVIIFEISSINDFNNLSYKESEKNIETILNRLNKQFPKAKIYTMPPNNVTIYENKLNKDGLSYSQYISKLEKFIESKNYTFLNYWDTYEKEAAKHQLSLEETLNKDGMHPNNKGYTIWFNSIKNEFRYLQSF